MKQLTSVQLLNKYLNGDKNVSYEDIRRACQRERFERMWNQASFQKEWLKPATFFPVLLYFFLWDLN